MHRLNVCLDNTDMYEALLRSVLNIKIKGFPNLKILTKAKSDVSKYK